MSPKAGWQEQHGEMALSYGGCPQEYVGGCDPSAVDGWTLFS